MKKLWRESRAGLVWQWQSPTHPPSSSSLLVAVSLSRSRQPRSLTQSWFLHRASRQSHPVPTAAAMLPTQQSSCVYQSLLVPSYGIPEIITAQPLLFRNSSSYGGNTDKQKVLSDRMCWGAEQGKANWAGREASQGSGFPARVWRLRNTWKWEGRRSLGHATILGSCSCWGNKRIIASPSATPPEFLYEAFEKSSFAGVVCKMTGGVTC